jgi:hypothetical protein
MEGWFNVGLTIFGLILASLLQGICGDNGDKGDDDNSQEEFHMQVSFVLYVLPYAGTTSGGLASL